MSMMSHAVNSNSLHICI